tara:strand:- start:122 stop:370 length:249 start_codon:yes stop_codon:yes gene_type:complete
MDKELVQYFIQECVESQEGNKRYKQNVRDFDDNYFKYSGKVEFKNNIIRDHNEILLKTCPDKKPIIHNNMDKYQLKKNRTVW